MSRRRAVCLTCGCTEDRACPGGCFWMVPGLCSTCGVANMLALTAYTTGIPADKIRPWMDGGVALAMDGVRADFAGRMAPEIVAAWERDELPLLHEEIHRRALVRWRELAGVAVH